MSSTAFRIATLFAAVAAIAAPVALAQPDPGVQLLVKLRPTAPSDALARAEADERGTIPALGVHVLRVPAGRAQAALDVLRRSPDVAFAELDGVVEAARTPGDPWWPSQSSEAHVNAPAAWDTTTGSPGVVIAVLDTGVDPTTPDLQGALVPGWDFVQGDASPVDDHGHGTMVAGVAAARGDNGIGIAGLCWSCSVMPVKVLGADGTGLQSNVAAGIVWAVDHGARVLNLSLSGGASDTLASAVQYARGKGAVVVAAAGNGGNASPTYPAALPGVLGVAGTNADDTLNLSSNYGSWVSLAAPFCNLATSMRQADGSYRYASFCGTSSATPVVAGIAALELAHEPGATNVEVEHALEAGAVPIAGIAGGRVDAAAALGAATVGAAPAAIAAPVVSGSAAVGQLLTASPGSWSGTPLALAYQWQRCGSTCTAIVGATSASYTVAAGDAGSALRVAVTASNAYGSSTALSASTATVAAPASSTSFSGTLSAKQPTQTFALQVGAGASSATLTFAKSPTLTLTVLAADGTVVATATGASGLALEATLAAGSYRYVVSGSSVKSGCAFTLVVAAAR